MSDEVTPTKPIRAMVPDPDHADATPTKPIRALVPDDERRVTNRANFALTVERRTAPLPRSVVRVRTTSYASAVAFVASFAALFAWPEVLWPMAPYVGIAGGAAIATTIASRVLQRRYGAAIRAARRWESRFWRQDGARLDALLTPAERILDYCAVIVVDDGARHVLHQMFVLTNLRVFVTKGLGRRLRAEPNVPLRYVQGVVAGALGRLAGAGDFLDLERGTGALEIEYGDRRKLTHLFPSDDEAVRARAAIEEAKPRAPKAERGALAVVDGASEGGALAIAQSPGLSIVDEE